MSLERALHTLGYPLAALMLVAWALVTFAGPGWGFMHLFLILGVSLLIWRVVQGGAPAKEK